MRTDDPRLEHLDRHRRRRHHRLTRLLTFIKGHDSGSSSGRTAFLASSVALNIANFLFHSIISRMLGPSSYGALASLLNVQVVLSVPISAVQAAVTQHVVRLKEDGADEPGTRLLLKEVLRYSLVSTVVWISFAIPIEHLLRLNSPIPPIMIGTWIAPGAALAAVQGVFMGCRRFGPVASSQLLYAMARLAAGVIFVRMGFGVSGAAISSGVGAALALLILLVVTRETQQSPNGLDIAGNKVARSVACLAGATILTSMDAWLARRFLSPSPAGYFTAAATAGRIPFFLTGAIALVYFPRFASRRGRSRDAARALVVAVPLVLVTGVVAAGALAAEPHLVIGVLFGSDFYPAVPVLSVIALADAAAAVVMALIYYELARESRAALGGWAGSGLAAGLAAAFHSSTRALAFDMLATNVVTAVVMGTVVSIQLLRDRRGSPPEDEVGESPRLVAEASSVGTPTVLSIGFSSDLEQEAPARRRGLRSLRSAGSRPRNTDRIAMIARSRLSDLWQMRAERRLLRAACERAVRAGTTVGIVGAAGYAVVSLITYLRGLGGPFPYTPSDPDLRQPETALATLTWTGLALSTIAAVVRSRIDGRASGTDPTWSGVTQEGGTKKSLWKEPSLWLGLAVVLIVFRGVFFPGAISYGDWGYYSNSGAVRNFFPIPAEWTYGNLGGSNILGTFLYPIFSGVGALARIGLPYSLLERVFFYWPAIFLNYLGPVWLLRRLGVSVRLAVIGGLFYATNSYIVTILYFGQLTVGLGNALYPLVALAALRVGSRPGLSRWAQLGALVGVQAWCDPRTAGLSVAGLMIGGVAVCVKGGLVATAKRMRIGRAVAGIAVAALLQGPWLIPSVFYTHAALPGSYTSGEALQGYSFMSLGDGLGLFHPFWPRFIFVSLFSLPIMWVLVPAAASLALRRSPGTAAPAMAIYLVFAALVSGSNSPFGSINVWLFDHVPGMNLFRDPSPYFGPALIGLLVGTGLAIKKTSAEGEPDPLSGRLRISARSLSLAHTGRLSLVMAPLALIAISAWPVASGSVTGALRAHDIPQTDVLTNRALQDIGAGSVLWVPAVSRFATVSVEQPAIAATALPTLTDIAFPYGSEGWAWLNDPAQIKAVIVKYAVVAIVVPTDQTAFDPYGLVAVDVERAVSQAVRDTNPDVFGSNKLFVVSNPPPSPIAVYGPESAVANAPLNVQQPSFGSTLTAVVAPSRSVRVLVFWQRFDSYWEARTTTSTLVHERYRGWANAYVLPPSTHPLKVKLSYGMQTPVDEGYVMILTGLAVLITLVVGDHRRRLRTSEVAEGARQ